MGNVTANSTFITQNVTGNRRVVYAHVPAGGSTSDTLVVPLQVVDFVSACFRSSVVAGSSVVPSLSIEGSTISIFQLAATTGTAYTVKAEGR